MVIALPKPPKINKRVKDMKVVFGMFDVTDLGLGVILGGIILGSIKFYLQCGQFGDCLT